MIGNGFADAWNRLREDLLQSMQKIMGLGMIVYSPCWGRLLCE